ncbi:MAG: hypothetical protein ACOY90_09605 [Candidatus Zhuqueibacterota bacterium]
MLKKLSILIGLILLTSVVNSAMGQSSSFSISNSSNDTLLYVGDNGRVGIGTTTPLGPIHIKEGFGGIMLWFSEDLDETVQTIIPDCDNDVKIGAFIEVILAYKNSVGAEGFHQKSCYGAIGTSYLIDGPFDVYILFNINSDGSVTVKKTAGNSTLKIVVRIMWV